MTSSQTMTDEERAAWRAQRAEEDRIRRERALAYAAAHPLSAEDKALARRTNRWINETLGREQS